MGDIADYYRDIALEADAEADHLAAAIHVKFAQYRKTGVCDIVWVSFNGVRWRINCMATNHLVRSRATLMREKYRSNAEDEMLRVLDYELQKRLEMAKKSDSYYDPALSWNDEGQIEHTKDNTEELFRFFDHNPYGLNSDKGDAFIASLKQWFEEKEELTPNQFKAIAKMYQYQCSLAGAADAYHEDRGL